MVNAASAEPPAGTVTVRDRPFATVQFPATPDRTTVWLPAGTGMTGMVWSTPIGCGVPLATAKGEPSGSRLCPHVVVVTLRLPPNARPLIVNAAGEAPPPRTAGARA